MRSREPDGGATPRAQVGNFGAETRLEKPQHGSMIEQARGANPPLLNGEITSIGTQKPRPMGPRICGELTIVGSGTAGAVTYSPAVPGGAVTGGTWSKNPPFSSYVTISAVFAHCTGFVLKAVIIEERVISPKSEGAGGDQSQRWTRSPRRLVANFPSMHPTENQSETAAGTRSWAYRMDLPRIGCIVSTKR
jgi:hypothetical protein